MHFDLQFEDYNFHIQLLGIAFFKTIHFPNAFLRRELLALGSFSFGLSFGRRFAFITKCETFKSNREKEKKKSW